MYGVLAMVGSIPIRAALMVPVRGISRAPTPVLLCKNLI